jgi:predicted  nucleic acid-binding Zn-ribbon protein
MQKLGVSSKSLKDSLAMQTEYVTRLRAELEVLRNTANACSTKIRNMELNLIRATAAEQKMINQTAALRAQMAQIRPDATFARLAYNAQNASTATRRLVADLGHNATSTQKSEATLRGLNKELEINGRLQAALTREVARSTAASGAHSTATRNLKTSLATAGLAGQDLRNRIQGLNAELTMSGRLSNIWSGSALSAGVMATAAISMPAGALLGQGIRYNAMMESNTTAFTTMTRSAKVAAGLMNDLQTMAMVTPFQTEDLTKQATTLQQYGASVRNTLPLLKTLGDLSLGNKEKFGIIAYNFAQAMSLGRLTAIDARSMTLAGFNPIAAISELRKSKGLSEDEASVSKIQDNMENGTLSIKELIEAMKLATSEKGLFYKAMENASKTYDGQMSTLRDNLVITLGVLTEPLFTLLAKSVLPTLNKITMAMRRMAEVNPKFTTFLVTVTLLLASIGPLLIGIYAVYRSVIFLQKAWLTVGIIVEAAKARIIPFLIGMHTWSLAAAGRVVLLAGAWALLAATALVVIRNYGLVFDYFYYFGAAVRSTFKLVQTSVATSFTAMALKVSMTIDDLAARLKALSNPFEEYDPSKVSYSPLTKGLGLTAAAGLLETKKALEANEKNFAKMKEQGKETVDGITQNLKDDWKRIKDALPDLSFMGDMPKLDIPEIDPKDFLDSTKDANKKEASEMQSFVEKIKEQARNFRDALGLFDKAVAEKLSGERLLVRLKSQLKVFDTWQASIATLRKRLGAGSQLYLSILGEGPKSAGQAKGLASLSDLKLQEYKNMFERKSATALLLGGEMAGANERDSKKIEQIQVNINGGVVLGNIDQLVELITRQLRVQGLV